jgi:DNA modification methylase
MSKTIGEMENRVMCGDCLQLLAELPDESINMRAL